MKQTKKSRVIASLCTISLTAAVAVACSNSPSSPSASSSPQASAGATNAPSAPVPVSLIQPDLGRVWKDDNPVTKEIEKQANIKLAVTMFPNVDYANKYNVLAASGDIPDIIRASGFDFQKYADQGLYLDLAPYLDKYAPNLKKALKPELWDLTKYKGKQFAIPYENIAGKEVPVLRKDWLDALNLKMPTNLDELETVLKAFTFNDPDKNGKNDTYGFGTAARYDESVIPIFGAFGVATGQIGQGAPIISLLKDNKVYPVAISPEYKASVEYLKKLWDDKVIDPELFTIKPDQAQQKAAKGRIGFFTSWWSMVPQILTQQLKMKELVPNASWEPVYPGLTGPDGKSGMLSYGNIGASVSISSKAKNPEAAIKFLDYLASDEGWELSHFGIKGTHYTSITDPRTPDGQKAFDEKWLDPLAQISSRQDLVDKVNQSSKDPIQIENNRFIYTATKYTLYQDVFYGIPLTDEQKTYGADVSKYEEEMFIKFMTGAEPLSKWNEYIETWKKKGGKTILDAKIKKYNELKSSNVTSGL
ncbi:extracellular solute-binding protein [Paenibacillus sp. SI8]|uniref:extracellular solute-binding protein n=1 Tax=unclassified Paenibacillus TaxID=185978 RepID=UPI0034671F35